MLESIDDFESALEIQKEHAWFYAITYGELKLAQWLYENYPEKCNIWNERIGVFKPNIFTKPKENIEKYSEVSVDIAIYYKQFEIAKWMHLSGIKDTTYSERFMQTILE